MEGIASRVKKEGEAVEREGIMKDPVFAEDARQVASEECVDWEALRGRTVAVTGATGLLGRIIVCSLLCAGEARGLDMTVLALARSEEKAKRLFGNPAALRITRADVLEPVPKGINADYLIHAASVTASREMVERPVETILTTVDGTKNMLSFAAGRGMRGAVYISSMEAYGIADSSRGPLREEDLGSIDILSARSSYPEGKRLAECLCAAYASEYGLRVSIARLAQTFGAGIDESENRVFAQFARSSLRGEDIVLRTRGEKANSFCYTSDAAAGILTILTRGEGGAAYNVANPEAFCSIRELAETFAEAGGGASRVTFDLPDDPSSTGYAPDSVTRLCADRLLSLGWHPRRGMGEMARRLMESMGRGGI